jgi:hypothetical protein
MPMLYVHCASCGGKIPTGLELDQEAFKDLTFTDRTVECPLCETLQTWGLDDVDTSVFRKKPGR